MLPPTVEIRLWGSMQYASFYLTEMKKARLV